MASAATRPKRVVPPLPPAGAPPASIAHSSSGTAATPSARATPLLERDGVEDPRRVARAAHRLDVQAGERLVRVRRRSEIRNLVQPGAAGSPVEIGRRTTLIAP